MFKEFSEDSRSEEFLNEFRQKMADQTASNIEERQIEMRRSRSIFVGAVAGLIMAGVVGGFMLSKQYKDADGFHLPIIRKPVEATKTAPEDRGGMLVENRDKSVYEVIENKDSAEVVVEKVLPAAEEPKMPEVVPIEETKRAASVEELIDKAEKTAETVKEGAVEKVAEAKDKVAEVKNKVVESTKSDATIKSGNWVVQLMSSPNRAAVEKSWGDLNKKHTFLNSLPHEVETADLSAKGIYYRLIAGSYADKAQADELCAKFKSAGGSCIVKKK